MNSQSSNKKKRQQQAKTVIIGAGPAGVAAAVKLESYGLEDFIVLEASDRIGGRVYSRSVRNGGPKVEIGAQWIHGEDKNVVHDLADKLGYLSKENPEPISEADAVFTLEGKIVDSTVIHELMKIFSQIEESLDNELMDAWHNYTSLKHYFDSKLDELLSSTSAPDRLSTLPEECENFSSLIQIYMKWFDLLQASIDGAPSMSKTAMYQNIIYEECEGDQMTNIIEDKSYQSLIEEYGEKIKEKIAFGKRVEKIEYSEDSDQIKIITDGKEEFVANICVVTLPLGVMKECHSSMFSPPLPDWKQNAISKMGFGNIAKLFLIFEDKVSSSVPGLPLAGFNFLRREAKDGEEEEESSWKDSIFGLYPVPSDEHVMVAWLSGNGAYSIESVESSEILAGASELLDAFIRPLHPSFPVPVKCHVTTWATSTLSRGTYSFLTPETPYDTPETLSKPVARRLLFAGEATHSCYFSTVHGAIESGWKAADEVKRLLKSENDKDL